MCDLCLPFEWKIHWIDKANLLVYHGKLRILKVWLTRASGRVLD
jgi:hypothetical protein